MLTDAELARIRAEDALQRNRRDHQVLRELGVLTVQRKFNPSEPRIPGGPHGGEWGSGGGVAKALRDTLKLGDKADLQPGEKLVGSDRVLGDSGTIRMALVDHGGQKSLRLGIGGYGFGARDDEAGPWRAGPDRTAEINAESQKLRAEQDRIETELNQLDADPHANPVRKAELQKRYDEIDEIGTGEVFPSGYTAKIDQAAATHLQSRLSDALGPAAAEEARQNKVWDQIEQLQAKQTLSPVEQDALNRLRAEADGFGKLQFVFGEGVVPGDWADVHYRVVMDDDLSIGTQVYLAAVPHGSGQTFEDLTDNEQAATLDPAETKKFLRLLGQYAGTAGSVLTDAELERMRAEDVRRRTKEDDRVLRRIGVIPDEPDPTAPRAPVEP